jgi:oxygen-independent coproporphyrinogen-3 oxidase
MSGIYIHIPFCKQACHYCNFHFSTSLVKKEEMVLALAKEIELRKNEFFDVGQSGNSVIETIYFGGGTPSILEVADIKLLIDKVYQHFEVAQNPEITIEVNPDDLSSNSSAQGSKNLFEQLKNIGINRLSIGIQSFFEADLKMMNRAHNSEEAKACLQIATQYFNNISVDLIYGIPGLTNENWSQNIETAMSFGIPHISSYALTVEPKTVFQKWIQNGKIDAPKDEVAAAHFSILVKKLEENGFIHYELSSFGKENFFSKNNSGYWLGRKYLGIGPSAHSYNGKERSWNVANNTIYLKSIAQNKLPFESELLTITDQYNEYIMTGLRTMWGISLERIETEFGKSYLDYLEQQAEKFIKDKLLFVSENVLKTSAKGKFLCDGIASDLFLINKE